MTLPERKFGIGPAMRKFYRRTRRNSSSVYHEWIVESCLKSVCVSMNDFNGARLGSVDYHYRLPPEKRELHGPNVHNCEVTGGACWHSSDSEFAHEFWIPFWDSCEGDHDKMLNRIEQYIKDGSVNYIKDQSP